MVGRKKRQSVQSRAMLSRGLIGTLEPKHSRRGASTYDAPLCPCPAWSTCFQSVAGNYGTNVTLLSRLFLEGMAAAMVVEGSVSNAGFETYVKQDLRPTLHPCEIVIMDNL